MFNNITLSTDTTCYLVTLSSSDLIAGTIVQGCMYIMGKSCVGQHETTQRISMKFGIRVQSFKAWVLGRKLKSNL